MILTVSQSQPSAHILIQAAQAISALNVALVLVGHLRGAETSIERIECVSLSLTVDQCVHKLLHVSTLWNGSLLFDMIWGSKLPLISVDIKAVNLAFSKQCFWVIPNFTHSLLDHNAPAALCLYQWSCMNVLLGTRLTHHLVCKISSCKAGILMFCTIRRTVPLHQTTPEPTLLSWVDHAKKSPPPPLQCSRKSSDMSDISDG